MKQNLGAPCAWCNRRHMHPVSTFLDHGELRSFCSQDCASDWHEVAATKKYAVPREKAGDLFHAADSLARLLSDMGYETQLDEEFEVIKGPIPPKGTEAEAIFKALHTLSATYSRLNQIA